ncbi:phosphotransferase [Amorphoplanes nipponensis]|uniref:Phosphotransferase n=1 Tax=Actinoplanes nipponensis TaxID=135950 RepID=A0A919JIZ0_9ACTN|nr:phosphotransferase [Actinoplanes nipponensis]
MWNLDGTLIRRDTLLPFLRQVCGPIQVGRAVAVATGRRLARSGHDGPRARLLQQLLGARVTAEVDVVARRHAEDLFAHRLRADCLRRWQWHRHHGHRLVIVSSSPEVYVGHLGTLLGADTVIATRMASVNGRLTGRISGGDRRGAERARRVLAHTIERPAGLLWAYGNLPADRDLLDLADIAIQVRPLRHLNAMTDA